MRLLATYRELFSSEINGNDCIVEVTDGDTFEAVLRKLNVPIGPASVILINGRTSKPGQKLEDSDVLCAFPSMAGG
ncbi:MAG: hypothetical protein U9Q82_11490 [Chloroflexota bacterium]|nr:hypothetical protein [Chloroflexota bacterium]